MKKSKKEKPHLLITYLQQSGGGAEKQAALIAEATKEIFEITLVVSKPVCGGWRCAMQDKGFSVIVLQKHDTLLERRLRNQRLFRICCQIRPDLIYSRFIDFNIFLAKKRGERALACPLVIQEVNTPSKWLKGDKLIHLLYKGKIARHYPKADLILCNGLMARQDILQNFPVSPSKCFYLPNMLNLSDMGKEFHRKEDFTDNGTLRIACVGRIVKQKDYWTMLEAVRIVLEHVRVEVKIFGDGPLKKKLEKDIGRYQLDNAITLMGYVPNVKAQLNTFDLLLSCSKHEGMSNAMLEAMAIGLPVVVTDVSGSRDVIRNSEGIIFPPGDTKTLAQILEYLAQDKNRLTMLAHKGKKRARDFLVSRIGKEYCKVLLGAIANQ